MKGITRAGFFKSHGLEKSRGAPTSALPPGVDATFIPVISDINAIVYNPNNLPSGTVTPAANIAPSLRSNLKTIAANSIKKPSAIVVFTAHYSQNSKLFVSVVYSRYSSFPGNDTKEKNLITQANSGVTFSLNDLLPGTTYYVKAQARSLLTGVSSVLTPSSPIIINTPVAPTTGLFGWAYYINGQVTPLSNNGTGEWNGVFYVKGQPTELVETPDFGWSGVYNGQQYYYGTLAHSLINGQWWYHGGAVTEFFFNGGNGIGPSGLFYQSFSPFTGVHEGVRYTAGVIRPELDLDGNGTINQILHVAGMPYTGTLQGVYYINGQITELGAGGTGIWNGNYYSGGVYVGAVGNPYDSGQTSSQGSRFSQGVTYG